MAKVFSLIEVLCLGGIYELLLQLLAQFTLSAVRVNVEVTWSSNKVLVGISNCSVSSTSHHVCIFLLRVQSIILDEIYPRIMSRGINWTRSNESCSIEFGEQGEEVGVFQRTWEKNVFHRVCVTTLYRYSDDSYLGVSTLGRLIDAVGLDVSVMSISGRSINLVEAFREYFGSGHRQKLIENPNFDLHLFRRCLQRTASSVLGSLDGFAMTDSIVNWLKAAETRDWMSCLLALRKAILTNDLTIPQIVDVLANNNGVWPLIVSYLQETGRKDDGDSLVVRSFSFLCIATKLYPSVL